VFRENCRQAGSNPVAKSLSHELPCSGVLEGDGLDLTTEKCVCFSSIRSSAAFNRCCH
jgi:hypothetical protein